MVSQKGPGYGGFVVETLGEPSGDKPKKVLISANTFGQYCEVILSLFATAAVNRSSVDLASKDWLDSMLQCCFLEWDVTAHVPVLRQRHRLHLKLVCPPDVRFGQAESVEKAESAVALMMERNVSHTHQAPSFLRTLAPP
jgi:hypothetical protein